VTAATLAVKDSLKTIDKKKQAIAKAKVVLQSQEVQAKRAQGKKRQLEAVEKETYEPLKYAAADGLEGSKRLATLRRAGKAYGFHKELLSIAPVILRKPLDSRHTFEDLVVRQLASEFNKYASSLGADVKSSEDAVKDCTRQLDSAEEELAAARVVHKKATRDLGNGEVAVLRGSQALADAKNSVRKLPADLKRAERSLAQTEARLLKFQQGPWAAFESALGLEFGAVASRGGQATKVALAFAAETQSSDTDHDTTGKAAHSTSET